LGFGDPPGGDANANLFLLRGIHSYAQGRPVLIGASRKRFVGALTGLADPKDRVEGSVAAAVEAVEAGAAIVRVHDVADTVAALRGLARGDSEA
jgi:dihydropteroate synthase